MRIFVAKYSPCRNYPLQKIAKYFLMFSDHPTFAAEIIKN